MKRKLIVIFSIVLAVSVTLPARGEITAQVDESHFPEGPSKLGWMDSRLLDSNYIYSATKEACAKVTRDILLSGRIFPSHSPNFDELINNIHREALLKSLTLSDESYNVNEAGLVHSSGYERALQECFPDETYRDRFDQLVKRRAALATMLATFVQLIVLNKGVGFAAKMLASTKIFKWALIVSPPLAGIVQSVLEALRQKEISSRTAKRCENLSGNDCTEVALGVGDVKATIINVKMSAEQEIVRLERLAARESNQKKIDDIRATIANIRSLLAMSTP